MTWFLKLQLSTFVFSMIRSFISCQLLHLLPPGFITWNCTSCILDLNRNLWLNTRTFHCLLTHIRFCFYLIISFLMYGARLPIGSFNPSISIRSTLGSTERWFFVIFSIFLEYSRFFRDNYDTRIIIIPTSRFLTCRILGHDLVLHFLFLFEY